MASLVTGEASSALGVEDVAAWVDAATPAGEVAVVAALLWYAMVAEAITDIAHVCALTMGFLLVQADEAYSRRIEEDYEELPAGTPRARML